MSHESDTPNMNISNFKGKVIECLKEKIKLINCKQDQKESIWSKSIEILEYFISRMINNEVKIPKVLNPKKIVNTIIYIVINLSENLFNINLLST